MPQTYREAAFEQWAPPGALWTPWAKPVLFAQMERRPAGPRPLMDVSWAPAPSANCALVLDLPSDQSVHLALDLARIGYRPVPLFNCCHGPSPVLELDGIMAALQRGPEVLSELRLPDDAPPAFMLDSRRMAGTSSPAPGRFDNRWVVLPQDFPSATFLLRHEIKRVILVTENGEAQPRNDLAHVLLRWQEAGIRIAAVGAPAGWSSTFPQSEPPPARPPRDITVSKPSWFRMAWYVMLATFGLRANSAGGFGAVIPMPSQG